MFRSKSRLFKVRARSSTYIFEKRAGQGQTADVWKARRIDSEGHSSRTVAVKYLRHPDALPWLKREFETLTRIRSLHCAQVLAWENFDRGLGLVLEWIDGISLYELARSGHLQSQWMDEIVAQIQEGLRALNDQGFFHGDLSPANILIDRAGLVRLVDFACATELEGEIHGTPAYLAPERWRGAEPSIACDLFALGLIAHDIETDFQFCTEELNECRKRVESLAVDWPNSALSRNPRDRRFREVENSESARHEMAEVVNRVLNAVAIPPQKTLLMEPARRIRHPLLPLVATFFTFLVYGQAQAPLPAKVETPATIEVRSHRWLHLNINGKDVGFTPIKIATLRAGTHHLRWQTAQRSGSVRLELRPGEKRLLSDHQLFQASRGP